MKRKVPAHSVRNFIYYNEDSCRCTYFILVVGNDTSSYGVAGTNSVKALVRSLIKDPIHKLSKILDSDICNYELVPAEFILGVSDDT